MKPGALYIDVKRDFWICVPDGGAVELYEDLISEQAFYTFRACDFEKVRASHQIALVGHFLTPEEYKDLNTKASWAGKKYEIY
jgi:hypothetical protein